jgi:hypothetical protein
MDVDWVATDPESGRFSGIYATSTFRELEDRLAALRARGEGYFQVARIGHEYPYLILGFCGAHGVLYRMDNAETMLIHVGDGAVSEGDEVMVLVMEDHNDVSGKYALTLERAWGVVKEFAATGATGGDEAWLEL